MHQTSNDIKAQILFSSDASSPSCSLSLLFSVFCTRITCLQTLFDVEHQQTLYVCLYVFVSVH